MDTNLYIQQKICLLLSTTHLIFWSLFSQGVIYAAEPVSVAVVNVTILMENAPQSEAASKLLKEKFLPQEERLAAQLVEIKRQETELKNLLSTTSNKVMRSIKERELRSSKRARERALQDFREELRFARDSALDIVQKEVFNAIDEVREQQQIDIILQTFLSADKRVDITNKVLEHLKNKLEKISQEKTPQT